MSEIRGSSPRYAVLTAEQLAGVLACSDKAVRWYLSLVAIIGGRSRWWIPGGVEAVGAAAGQSPATAWRAVRELRAAGLVTSDHRGSDGTGWHLSQSWCLPPSPVSPDRTRPVSPDRTRPVSPDRTTGTGEDPEHETPPSPPCGGEPVRDLVLLARRAASRRWPVPLATAGPELARLLAAALEQRREQAEQERETWEREQETAGRRPVWEPCPVDETMGHDHLVQLAAAACARVQIRARRAHELLAALDATQAPAE